MTTVSDIIRDAYRETNLVAITEVPTGVQQDEGLKLFNRLISSVYGHEMGEPLLAYPVGENNVERNPVRDNRLEYRNYCIPSNSRLMLNLESAQTVYLPPVPKDGARFEYVDVSGNLATYNLTVVGNGNNINGADTLTVSTDGASASYVYRQDLGDWLSVAPLVSTDTFPFPPEFEDFFVIGLAMRLNPRSDVTLDEQSLTAFRRYSRIFKARYRQTKIVPVELALLMTPVGEQRFNRDDDFDTSAFYFPGN
jgi:hypothetical protein